MGLSYFFNKNSNLINLFIIAPCLFFVDFSYSNFAILALMLGFLILIQNIFLILYKTTNNLEKKKHWCKLLTNFLYILLLVPLCFYQFVNPSFNIYNKFVAVFLFLYSSLKLIFKKKYEKMESCKVVNNIKNYNNLKQKKLCPRKHVVPESSSSSSSSSSQCVSTEEAYKICNKYNIKSD
jgi:hypothetical protein